MPVFGPTIRLRTFSLDRYIGVILAILENFGLPASGFLKYKTLHNIFFFFSSSQKEDPFWREQFFLLILFLHTYASKSMKEGWRILILKFVILHFPLSCLSFSEHVVEPGAVLPAMEQLSEQPLGCLQPTPGIGTVHGCRNRRRRKDPQGAQGKNVQFCSPSIFVTNLFMKERTKTSFSSCSDDPSPEIWRASF